MKQITTFACGMIVWCCAAVATGQFVGEDFFDEAPAPADAWEGSFALGLNGKSGNSKNLDINLDLNLSREDEVAITDILMTYFYSSNALGTSTDRFFGQARQERKLANPDFTWFYMGSYEYDRFKNFDYRLAFHTGLGVLLYEFDDRFLKSRVGAGASREFGGTSDEWLPELQFGLDWERHLSERTRLFASADFFPNVEDFSDYRLNTRAGFETLVDEALDMRLRMFVFNRFDSTPGAGFRDNDVEYGAAFVFGF